jgi:UDP-3-O-[3-hydroxymyristoyl] N-acetylglucosamine deacetylase
MTLKPGAIDSGIVFRRTDEMEKDQYILANYKNVTNTMLGTTVSNEDGVSVATIEHLMAAFWGCGIDNAMVELDGEEIPIMDGSSEPFVFLIECAGIIAQEAPRKYIEVLKKINVSDGNKEVTITPSEDFSVSLEIDFEDKIIANQKCSFNSSDVSFKTDLCRARTFGFEHEVNKLRSLGLARGGSLENAIVVSGDKVLNKGGLRYNDEFVRHKVLDCIGDFYLTGAHLKGHFHGIRSGHALNNKLLHQIFADSDAWRVVTQA